MLGVLGQAFPVLSAILTLDPALFQRHIVPRRIKAPANSSHLNLISMDMSFFFSKQHI